MAVTQQLARQGQIPHPSPHHAKREAVASPHHAKREAVSSPQHGKREAVSSRREEIGARRRRAADRRRQMRKEMEEKEKPREDLFVAPKKMKMDDADLTCRKVLGEFEYLFILFQNQRVPDGFNLTKAKENQRVLDGFNLTKAKENVSLKSETQRKRKLSEEAVDAKNTFGSCSNDDKKETKYLKTDKYCDLVGQIMQGRLTANNNNDNMDISDAFSDKRQKQHNKTNSPFKNISNVDKESLSENPFQLDGKFKREFQGKKSNHLISPTEHENNYPHGDTKENLPIVHTDNRPSIICSIPFERLKAFQNQLQLRLTQIALPTPLPEKVQMVKAALNPFSNTEDQKPKPNTEDQKPKPNTEDKKPKPKPIFYTEPQKAEAKSKSTFHCEDYINKLKAKSTFHSQTQIVDQKFNPTINTEAQIGGSKSRATNHIKEQISKNIGRNNIEPVQSFKDQNISTPKKSMPIFQTENKIDKQETVPIFKTEDKMKLKSMPILVL